MEIQMLWKFYSVVILLLSLFLQSIGVIWLLQSKRLQEMHEVEKYNKKSSISKTCFK